MLVNVIIVIASLFITPLEAKPQRLEQAPQVKPENQPENRLEPHNDTEKFKDVSASQSGHSSSEGSARVGKPNLDKANDEGTEFWPPLFGYRIKVTDSLLVLFTFLLWIATRNLVLGANDASRRELRAYVFGAPKSLTDIDPNKNIRVTFLFMNGGKTPAYSCVQSGDIIFVDHPLPKNFPFPSLDEPKSKSTIHPNLPFEGTIIAKNKFTRAQLEETLQAPITGGKRIYVFGRIDYVDAFKAKHWTTFCFSFAGHHDVFPLAQQGKWDEIKTIFSDPKLIPRL
jgi:hypothetical protein